MPDIPQGHGYLASTFAGSTAAVQLGDAGPWAVPLHQILDSRLGSAYGWIIHHPSQPARLAAGLDWLKHPADEKSSVRAYRDGFYIQSLSGEGSLFTPPPAGSLFHDFTPSQSPALASLLLSGAFLSQPSTTDFQIPLSGALLPLPLPTPSPSSSSFRLRLNPRSGLLSGSGQILDNGLPARSAQFGALWIPHRQSLAGCFTLPESLSTKSPIHAGPLNLTPLPAPP
jgi:hypothetical protein